MRKWLTSCLAIIAVLVGVIVVRALYCSSGVIELGCATYPVHVYVRSDRPEIIDEVTCEAFHGELDQLTLRVFVDLRDTRGGFRGAVHKNFKGDPLTVWIPYTHVSRRCRVEGRYPQGMKLIVTVRYRGGRLEGKQ